MAAAAAAAVIWRRRFGGGGGDGGGGPTAPPHLRVPYEAALGTQFELTPARCKGRFIITVIQLARASRRRVFGREGVGLVLASGADGGNGGGGGGSKWWRHMAAAAGLAEVG